MYTSHYTLHSSFTCTCKNFIGLSNMYTERTVYQMQYNITLQKLLILSVYLCACLSYCQKICEPLCISVCLSLYLFVFLYLCVLLPTATAEIYYRALANFSEDKLKMSGHDNYPSDYGRQVPVYLLTVWAMASLSKPNYTTKLSCRWSFFYSVYTLATFSRIN